MADTLTRQERGSLFRPWWGRGPLGSLRKEMDELFESFFGTGDVPGMAAPAIPSTDLSETDDAVEIKTDVPGFKSDEIDIELANDGVTISGKHSEESESDKGNGRKYHCVERRSGSFSRFVRLPCGVKEDKIDARLKDGVLTVTLPKSEKTRHQKVKVKA